MKFYRDFSFGMLLMGCGMLVFCSTATGQVRPTDREGAAKTRFERERPGPDRKWQRGEGQGPKPFLMASDPRFAKMLELALVEEDQLEQALQQWPEYQEMNPQRQQFLERRLNGFRERVRAEALEKAGEMDLSIPSGRENEFIRDYWTARIRIEKEVREMAEEELRKRGDQVRKRIENKWK